MTTVGSCFFFVFLFCWRLQKGKQACPVTSLHCERHAHCVAVCLWRVEKMVTLDRGLIGRWPCFDNWAQSGAKTKTIRKGARCQDMTQPAIRKEPPNKSKASTCPRQTKMDAISLSEDNRGFKCVERLKETLLSRRLTVSKLLFTQKKPLASRKAMLWHKSAWLMLRRPLIGKRSWHFASVRQPIQSFGSPRPPMPPQHSLSLLLLSLGLRRSL